VMDLVFPFLPFFLLCDFGCGSEDEEGAELVRVAVVAAATGGGGGGSGVVAPATGALT
jgi:hypothetical protein